MNVAEKGKETMEVLVQWSGLNPEETSWEKMETLIASFPSIRLEVESFSKGGGDVIGVTFLSDLIQEMKKVLPAKEERDRELDGYSEN